MTARVSVTRSGRITLLRDAGLLRRGLGGGRVRRGVRGLLRLLGCVRRGRQRGSTGLRGRHRAALPGGRRPARNGLLRGRLTGLRRRLLHRRLGVGVPAPARRGSRRRAGCLLRRLARLAGLPRLRGAARGRTALLCRVLRHARAVGPGR
ncbi:hypothetical protein, partial [Streptomyces cacaoi]|uniref:hypothetical protein n=1 Tax=Streptomyces cacaoi TaxID=1898 RepID=UPI003F4D2F87